MVALALYASAFGPPITSRLLNTVPTTAQNCFVKGIRAIVGPAKLTRVSNDSCHRAHSV